MARTRLSLLATFGLIALASCAQAVPDGRISAVTKASLQEEADTIFKRVGLTPPPSAVVEYAEYQHGMDDSARLVMMMPTADWKAMQASPPLNSVAPDLYLREEAASLGANKEGWRPRDDPSVVATQVLLNGGLEGLNVGVGSAGTGRVRVYLYWIQT